MKETYTTEEAAAVLGVSSARVRQLILDGVLKTERFGRAHVITREGLEAARQRQTTPGPAPRATEAAPAAGKRATGQTSADKGTPAKRRGRKAA